MNTHTYFVAAALAACLTSAAQAENYTTITFEKRSGDRIRQITVGSTLWTGLKASRRRAVGGVSLEIDTLVSGSDETTLQALVAGIQRRGVIDVGSKQVARLTIEFVDGTTLALTGPKDAAAWSKVLPAYPKLEAALLRMEAEAMQREAESTYTSKLYQRAAFEVLRLSTFNHTGGAPGALDQLRYLQTVVASRGWKDQTLKSPEALNRLLKGLAGPSDAGQAEQLTQALKRVVLATRGEKRSYRQLGIDVDKRRDMKYSEAHTLHGVIEEAAKMGIAQVKGREVKTPLEVREAPEETAGVASRIPLGTRVMVAHVLPDGEWVLIGFPKATPGVELEAVAKRSDGRRLTGGFVKATDLDLQVEPGASLLREVSPSANVEGLRGKVVSTTGTPRK